MFHLNARDQPGTISSFKGGLSALPDAMARKLGKERLALGQALQAVHKVPGTDSYK